MNDNQYNNDHQCHGVDDQKIKRPAETRVKVTGRQNIDNTRSSLQQMQMQNHRYHQQIDFHRNYLITRNRCHQLNAITLEIFNSFG